MAGDVMIIEGFDCAGSLNLASTFSGAGMYSDIDSILPPDIAGFGAEDEGIVRALLPDVAELRSTIMAGGGVAGGIVLGLGVERLLTTNLNIPKGAVPFVDVGVGAIAGKLLFGVSPALGAGVAAGFAGLGVIRFLQTFLNMDVNLSGLLDGVDLGDLSAGDEDLLPPELQAYDQVAIEELDGMGDYGQVVAEEVGAYNMAGVHIG